MKIIFTADWHIKLGQKLVPVEWQVNRYKLMVDLLNEQPADLMIIGGDIFDRIPTLDELALYHDLMAKINKPTIIYSGNHEALSKKSTFLSKLKPLTESVNKEIKIVDEFMYCDGFDILPYNELTNFVNGSDYTPNNQILFTHVRGAIEPHVTPEIDLSLLEPWPIVFAGDLHSHSNCQRNIVYPGSPLTTSFHRSLVSTGYILIDTDSSEWEWKELNVPQLIRETVTDPKLMKPTEFHHTVYEVEGDISELAKVGSNDLLDKKIVSTKAEASLNLNKDMKISEELRMFLTDILKLKDEDIEGILTTYHAYIIESAME